MCQCKYADTPVDVDMTERRTELASDVVFRVVVVTLDIAQLMNTSGRQGLRGGQAGDDGEEQGGRRRGPRLVRRVRASGPYVEMQTTTANLCTSPSLIF